MAGQLPLPSDGGLPESPGGVFSLSAFRFNTHAAALTAASPNAPRLSHRDATGWLCAGDSRRRYVSASGESAGGRGFARRSGAGIQRLM